MSIYYHEFVPDVIGNVWFWFGLAAMVVSFWLGMTCYRDLRSQSRDERAKCEKILDDIEIFFAVIFAVLLLAESRAGLIQLFDNQLRRDESGAWSLFGAVFAAIVAGGCLLLLLQYSTKLGAWVGEKKHERRRRIQHREYRRWKKQEAEKWRKATLAMVEEMEESPDENY